MKNSKFYALAILVVCTIFLGCKEEKKSNVINTPETEDAVKDSTFYGVCGEGTSMHSLELITNEGDTLYFMLNVNEDADEDAVKGGLLAGDKLAVIKKYGAEEQTAERVINLTTLEGKWVSLDRNFEIVEGGEVLSTLQSETNPYVSWQILNGQLLMGKDTFDVHTLDSDTLALENSKGIFVYSRK